MICAIIRFLKWITMRDYDEAKAEATRRAIDMIDHG